MSSNTTRKMVAKMINDRLEPLDDFSLPAVAADITEKIKADEALKNAYVDESLYHLVYVECMNNLSSNRLKAVQIRAVAPLVEAAIERATGQAPESPSTLRQVMQRGRRNRLRWLKHTEYIGDRHVKLMAMKREQIPLAIAIRTKRRDAEDGMINLLRTLYDGLVPRQGIGDGFSAERIEAIYQAIETGQPIPPEEEEQAI